MEDIRIYEINQKSQEIIGKVVNYNITVVLEYTSAEKENYQFKEMGEKTKIGIFQEHNTSNIINSVQQILISNLDKKIFGLKDDRFISISLRALDRNESFYIEKKSKSQLTLSKKIILEGKDLYIKENFIIFLELILEPGETSITYVKNKETINLVKSLVDNEEVAHCIWGSFNGPGHGPLGYNFGKDHRFGKGKERFFTFLKIPYGNNYQLEPIFKEQENEYDEYIEGIVFNFEKFKENGDPYACIGYGSVKHSQCFERKGIPYEYTKGKTVKITFSFSWPFIHKSFEEIKEKGYKDEYLPWAQNGKNMFGILLQFNDFRFDYRKGSKTKYAILLPEDKYKILIKYIKSKPLLIVDLYKEVFPEHYYANTGYYMLDFKNIVFVDNLEEYNKLFAPYLEYIKNKKK